MKPNNLFFLSIVLVFAIPTAKAFYVQEDRGVVIDSEASCFNISDDIITVQLLGLNDNWPFEEGIDRIFLGQRRFETSIQITVSGGAKINILDSYSEWDNVSGSDTVWRLEGEREAQGPLNIEIWNFEGISQITIQAEYEERDETRVCIPIFGCAGWEDDWSLWEPSEVVEKKIGLCKIAINPALPVRINR